MVFQNNVLSGAGGSGTAVHTIDQSIRFNDDDSGRMGRTPGSASNRRTWTFSVWIKRGNLDSSGFKFIFSRTEATVAANIAFYQDSLYFAAASAGHELNLTTNRKFRDPSAWYHIVIAQDTTQATSSERVRIYVNGQRETSFSTETYPALNYQGYINTAALHDIGVSRPSGSISGYFDGYMAEIVLIDGESLDSSSFGEYNSSGIWVPKDVSGLTFGTNGFHIKGEDSSDLGNDSSGNGNDYSTSGLAAHDQMLDSPTNNFATYNILNNYIGGHTFSEGNLKRVKNSTKRIATLVTQGASSGKWYCECYSVTVSQLMLGIQAYEPDAEPEWPGNGVTNQGYGYYSSNGQRYINGSGAAYGNSWTNGDIIGIAMDLDNNKLYFSKNGTFQNSGDPTSGSTGTGAISITDPADTNLGLYFFAFGDGSGTAAQTNVINCGQDGTFAGNTTAGGNSDGNGIGNFKYSVPSGYLALCTKNLGS